MIDIPIWDWTLVLLLILAGSVFLWRWRRELLAQLAERDTRFHAQQLDIRTLATEAARLPDALERSSLAETRIRELTQASQDAAGREAGLAARLEEVANQRSQLRSVLEERDRRCAALQKQIDEHYVALASSEAARSAAEDLVIRLRSERDAGRQELSGAKEGVTEVSAELAKAIAERDAANASHEQTKQFLQDVQARLRPAFIEVASRLFDEKAIVLDQRIQASADVSKQGLEATLRPFAEQVVQFQGRIEQINTEQTKDRAMLAGTIGELKSLNQNMADAAFAIAKALKGNAKVRGDWGELILDTVLKASGLEEGRNYTSQENTHDEAGQRHRPDVVVNLPDGRRVVVDSKVSLVAWADANNAETPEAYQDALVRHVAALRGHARDLSDRNYPKVLGPDTLDMTVLFVPIEGALSSALSLDPDLQTEAFAKHIVFASPNTLMAMLQVIERLWCRDKLQKQVEIIGAEAGKLLDALSGFLEDFQEIDTRIQQASKAFSAAKTRLIESPQSVTARARRLVEAGARGKRALPEELQPVITDTPLALTVEAE